MRRIFAFRSVDFWNFYRMKLFVMSAKPNADDFIRLINLGMRK